MKSSLKTLSSIESIDVSRSKPSSVGGYIWTVSFLNDAHGTHRGDMEEFQTHSNLSSGPGWLPIIKTQEVRKGTYKEVQKISVSAGGQNVSSVSSFKLRFKGETTKDILALPIGRNSCLGSKFAKQFITTSTSNTISEGGDASVSPLTTFMILYKQYESNLIHANNGTCHDSATKIYEELMYFPPLKDVIVSGSQSSTNDGGCVWEISLLSVIGNPDLFKGKIFLLVLSIEILCGSLLLRTCIHTIFSYRIS
jgi:hypothetical protein